jgi:hypothetical protein
MERLARMRALIGADVSALVADHPHQSDTPEPITDQGTTKEYSDALAIVQLEYKLHLFWKAFQAARDAVPEQQDYDIEHLYKTR